MKEKEKELKRHRRWVKGLNAWIATDCKLHDCVNIRSEKSIDHAFSTFFTFMLIRFSYTYDYAAMQIPFR